MGLPSFIYHRAQNHQRRPSNSPRSLIIVVLLCPSYLCRRRPDLYQLLQNHDGPTLPADYLASALGPHVFKYPFIIPTEHWPNIPSIAALERVRVLQKQVTKLNRVALKILMKDLPIKYHPDGADLLDTCLPSLTKEEPIEVVSTPQPLPLNTQLTQNGSSSNSNLPEHILKQLRKL